MIPAAFDMHARVRSARPRRCSRSSGGRQGPLGRPQPDPADEAPPGQPAPHHRHQRDPGRDPRSRRLSEIGALTRSRAGGFGPDPNAVCAPPRHLQVIADPVVRNLATLGGNLAHGDPANDHPATMLAYGAESSPAARGGTSGFPSPRSSPGPSRPRSRGRAAGRDPHSQPAASQRRRLSQLERKVGDFATAAVAVQLTLGAGGACEQAGIGLTNVGLTPIKAERAESALRGKRPDDATIAQAAQLAADARSRRKISAARWNTRRIWCECSPLAPSAKR